MSDDFPSAAMIRHPHPWSLREVRACLDGDLINMHNEMGLAIAASPILSFDIVPVRQTRDKIQRVLLERGIDMNIGLTLGGMGTLQSVSPNFVIEQPAQQRIFSLPASRPNITYQTIPIPQPTVSLPAPELPRQIITRDAFGNIVGVRNETEQEKDNREYEAWKREFGAK
jgi:hypothetical protein